MATELQPWWIDTYEQNVNHALQVKESVLEGTVTKKKCAGEKTRFQYIGTREMQERTEEDGDTRLTKNEYKTRWIYRKTYDDAFMLDEDDIERSLTDPTSDNTRAGIFGANRCKERMILRALGASVVEGHDADIVTPYDSNNVIDIQTGSRGTANQGLNLAKLYAIKEHFDGENLDPDDPRFIIVGTKQVTDLLDTTEIKNSDYNSVKVLCEGKVDTFLGFKFIRCNLLDFDSSSKIRGCWAYTKNSVGFTLDGGLKINVGIAPTKNFQRITQLVMKGGGCRIYDKGVLKVPCQEE